MQTDRLPITILGHVVGYATLGNLYDDIDGQSFELTNLELLPDREIPQEAAPYVRMILATTIEGLSLDRTTNSGT